MKMTTDAICTIPYPSWNRFRYATEHMPVRIEKIEYGSSISFHLLFCSKDSERVIPQLNEASVRKMEIISLSDAYMPWETE